MSEGSDGTELWVTESEHAVGADAVGFVFVVGEDWGWGERGGGGGAEVRVGSDGMGVGGWWDDVAAVGVAVGEIADEKGVGKGVERDCVGVKEAAVGVEDGGDEFGREVADVGEDVVDEGDGIGAIGGHGGGGSGCTGWGYGWGGLGFGADLCRIQN